jgi:hypothetical protein
MSICELIMNSLMIDNNPDSLSLSLYFCTLKTTFNIESTFR